MLGSAHATWLAGTCERSVPVYDRARAAAATQPAAAAAAGAASRGGDAMRLYAVDSRVLYVQNNTARQKLIPSLRSYIVR